MLAPKPYENKTLSASESPSTVNKKKVRMCHIMSGPEKGFLRAWVGVCVGGGSNHVQNAQSLQ